VILLDTDVLSIIQRADGREYENLVRRLDAANDEVAVSIISFEEQMRGWLAFVARSQTLNHQIKGYSHLHALLDDFTTRPVIDFDSALRRAISGADASKSRVGTMDLKIASIAMTHGALLLSRNLSHFRKVPGLHVEDWSVA
jgi:tRNA(fMet)-specific endonuclease VapC